MCTLKASIEPFPFLIGSVGCRNGDPSAFDDEVWDLFETKLLLSSDFCNIKYLDLLKLLSE